MTIQFNEGQTEWLQKSKRPSFRCWWQLSSVCNWINPPFRETNRYFWHMYASLRMGHCVKNYCSYVSWKHIPMMIQFIRLWRTISRKKHSTYKHLLMCNRWRPVHGWSPLRISKLFKKKLFRKSPKFTVYSIDNTWWQGIWVRNFMNSYRLYCSQQNQSEWSQFSTVPSAVCWKWRRFSMPASSYRIR